MKKQLLRDILHDLALVCCVGAVLDVALFALFFVIFLLVDDLIALNALVHVRAAFLIVGGLMLLICAGLLMFGKGDKLHDNDRWKKYFHRFDLFPVLLVTAVFPLVLAIALDYFLYIPR